MQANRETLPSADYPEIDTKIAEAFSGAKQAEEADAKELTDWCLAELKLTIDPALLTGLTQEQARDAILNSFDQKYRPEMRDVERRLLLDQLDSAWKSHLLTMDHLRSTVGLAGYAQEDPKIVYKQEGMKRFDEMWDGVKDRVTESVFRIEDVGEEQVEAAMWAGARAVHQQAQSAMQAQASRALSEQQSQQTNSGGGGDKKVEPIRNVGKKVGRNDPCPCGSGKKYKNCHMNQTANS
ncbi:MAG: SEC-C domain-containing protein [Bacteroidales bacterium]|nr:SEC-C domain-containing protein [Bacteroidales bacterium]